MFIPPIDQIARFSEEKMQKVNLYESGKMFADLYCLYPGQEQKTHDHEGEDKFYFVLEGEVSVTLGDETRRMGFGESCAAPAGVLHGVRNESDVPAIVLAMMAPHPSRTRFET